MLGLESVSWAAQHDRGTSGMESSRHIYEKTGLFGTNFAPSGTRPMADALRMRTAGHLLGLLVPPATSTRYFFQAAAHEPRASIPVLIQPRDPAAHRELWNVLQPTRVEHFRDVDDYFTAVT